MKKFELSIYLSLMFFIFHLGANGKVDINDTRFLNQPDISNNHIAFVYAEDIWIASLSGTNVRRLTSDDGVESNPIFSPDGKMIAFSAEYDGNTDVFIIPVEGGIPKRLTWHPSNDDVCGFAPDGSAVLFSSSRNVFTGRHKQLFTVSIEGSFPEQLEIPYAYKGIYSPDGKRLAYNPLRERFSQWKNYRGGTVSRICLYTFNDRSMEKILQPEGRCNDVNPMWTENIIYFLSDRNGEFNLFEYDINTKNINQLTFFNDFPILSASIYENQIIFEQAGFLHIYDILANNSKKLTIGVATDLPELRSRYVKGSNYVRSTSFSPSGARVVLDFRGEIITVPAKKGDPRNLTNTTGAHEKYPVWSPDGKSIAYFSDESREYKLHIKQQDGKDDVKKFGLNGSGFYGNPIWSPDSKKLTYSDNGRNLYWIDIQNGMVKKIASEKIYDPGHLGNIKGSWSSDSKWIVYTVNTEAFIEKVYLYSVEQNRSYPITDGLSDVTDPIFDKSGKYLYFFASTDAGPIKHWFAQSNSDKRMTRSIYLVTLQKDVLSPLAKENDEEEGTIEEKEEDKTKNKKSEKSFLIDFEGLESRIISVPVGTGNFFELQSGDEGQIYFLEAPSEAYGPFAKETKLHKYDFKERKDEVIISNINDYELSMDGKKILYRSGKSWKISNTSGKDVVELGINAIQVYINPENEWEQIFHEAWRINRDYFYATNMHGADWAAMYDKYSVFLPHLSCRMDLNNLIRWMCSELAVGHHGIYGGDFYQEPERIPGGLLGVDYSIENGRYRFAKIYGGLNWNPELRSPLTEPGINVSEGDYLLAVNGKELFSSMNIFSLFENTSNKIVEITVGSSTDLKDGQTVRVVPISNERALRNRDWIEGNIKKVDKATGGRVAYVYVPNTASRGHTYFKRYFFSQVHKDAIIIDERFNSGGLVADYYIDLLRRPFVSNWNTRYCQDFKSPSASIQGPKVMLINETAGSGGDLLPWMFRKFKMGKLIGKRTWGGLVGTLGYPNLMDGGYVTAPNLAFWTEEGWIVENVGVPPDIEVEQLPSKVIEGHDPQLEKAIEVILEELKKNPPEKLVRPPYPVRVRK